MSIIWHQILVPLDEDEYEEMKKIAHEKGLSNVEMIVQIIKKYMELKSKKHDNEGEDDNEGERENNESCNN